MSNDHEKISETGGIKALKDALKTTVVLLKITMVILVIAFLCSGIKNLEQYEEAVVLRFGQQSGGVRETSGMHFALPYPIDQVIVVPTGRTQNVSSQSFMYQKNSQQEMTPYLVPGVDGYLLTADINILHCESTLYYQIDDVSKYVFSIREKDRRELLISLIDAAIYKATAKLSLDAALDKKELIDDSKLILQKSMNNLGLGIKIVDLNITTHIPRQIEAVKQGVVQASQAAAQLVSKAESFKQNSLDLAESEAVQIRSQAQIWKSAMMARSAADFKTFEKLLKSYKENPQQVKEMLLRNLMVEVMPKLDEIFIFNENHKRQMRIIIPRKSAEKIDEGKEGEDDQ